MSEQTEASDSKESPISRFAKWRKESISALKNTPRAFRLVWQASPLYTSLSTGLVLLQGMLPLAQVWVSKLIVDGVVAAANTARAGGTPQVGSLLTLVGVFVGLWIIGNLIQVADQTVRSLLTELLAGHINEMILRQASRLDLSFYETPKFFDKMEKAFQEAGWRPFQVVNSVLWAFQGFTSAITMIGVLFRLCWWAPLLLLATSTPYLFAEFQFSRKRWKMTGKCPKSGRCTTCAGLWRNARRRRKFASST